MTKPNIGLMPSMRVLPEPVAKGNLPRQKKASKSLVVRRLRRVKKLYVEERTRDLRERLEHARGLAVQYKGPYGKWIPAETVEKNKLWYKAWSLEVQALEIMLPLVIENVSEYFDRTMVQPDEEDESS